MSNATLVFEDDAPLLLLRAPAGEGEVGELEPEAAGGGFASGEL